MSKTNYFTAKIEVDIPIKDREDMDIDEQKQLAIITANEIRRLIEKTGYITRLKEVGYSFSKED